MKTSLLVLGASICLIALPVAAAPTSGPTSKQLTTHADQPPVGDQAPVSAKRTTGSSASRTATDSRSASEPRAIPGVLVLLIPQKQAKQATARVAFALSNSRRYRIRTLAALRPAMRLRDRSLLERASVFRKQGKKAMLALDHEKAEKAFDAAIKMLEGGFIRYYDPHPLAELYLLKGVVALQRAQPMSVTRSFTRALHLDESFKLGSFYSPQVRNHFAEARKQLPPKPMPAPSELRRLIALDSTIEMALVVTSEGQLGGNLLKTLLFDGKKRAIASVETVLLGAHDQLARAQELGARLKKQLEQRFPAVIAAFLPGGNDLNLLPLPPTPPWYKRWYVWAIVGAVAVTAAGIAIPLATRDQVVDVPVKW
jgi:hypothetical protein